MSLQDWLEETRTSVSSFAAAVEVSRQTVHSWLTGTVPDGANLLKVQTATQGKVRPADFLPDAEGSDHAA
uniref:Bacterial antitoxin YdaS n=1 Tax=uncultured Caudovirales phage TaxID=2100421 RepID=A0A6J5L2Q2_9CAUD|nr:Putative bacterial antitoxin YdaS [uncultured Caudovirales phage]